jgi:hypothetical protein
MTKNVLTDSFEESLNGAKSARVNINAGDGNLTIDRLTAGEPLLASGALQYYEHNGPSIQSVASTDGQVTLSVKRGAGGTRWLRLPWTACNGATEWRIHLNPTVVSEITAHSDGGNVRLNLAGMAVTQVSADTGGGNMDVTLPDHAADLSATAKTGAGNVTIDIGGGIQGNNFVNAKSGAGNVSVSIPAGIAARVRVTVGLGKVMLDSRFCKADDGAYQSPDFVSAVDRVEITAESGAGSVSVGVR